MDVAAWLHGLGLDRYAVAFRDNDVTAEVLPHLSPEDLKELGISSIGHRRQLRAAISALSKSEPLQAEHENEGSATSVAPTDAGAGREVERRQITIMFSDLVGVTELSTKVDPEDLRQFLHVYRRTVAGEIERHHGFVAQYLGDGVLVYFGYPEAHENEAELAVRAALSVVGAIEGLTSLAGVRPQVRVGIATGLVVVGEHVRSGEVIGETPNLASRLQSLAKPGGIVIAESTRRLIGDLFECRSMEPVSVKGYAAPMRFWEVVGEGHNPSRFEALRSGRMSLVGREEELELLTRRWAQAATGEGRVVLVSGEPGIGKSELIAALKEHAAARPHVCLQYFCAPHMSDSVFYPILSQLEYAAGFERLDSAETKLQKLKSILSLSSSTAVEDAALLAEFLTIHGEGSHPKSRQSEQKRKELGRVDKSNPDTNDSEQHESSKALDKLIEACGDAT